MPIYSFRDSNLQRRSTQARSVVAGSLRRSALALLFVMWASACKSSVEPEPRISVVVVPASSEVIVGGSLQLQATVRNGAGVNWVSDRPDIASVNASGLVTAVSAGVVAITATATADPSASATVSITVKLAAPRVVSVSPTLDEVDVSIGAVVLVTFAEAISETLDPSWISLAGTSGGEVPGALSYDAASLTLTFTPEMPLTEFESLYSVVISGVTNPEGTPIEEDTQSDFSTEFLSPDYFYRLNNQFLGPDFVLDNFANTRGCHMAATSANTSGTFWHIERAPGRTTYLMKSLFGGEDLALEGGDGVNPCLLTGLAPPGLVFTGQLWSFTAIPTVAGAYRLQNERFGPSKSLDNYNDGRDPEGALMRDTSLFTGQAWYLVRSTLR